MVVRPCTTCVSFNYEAAFRLSFYWQGISLVDIVGIYSRFLCIFIILIVNEDYFITVAVPLWMEYVQFAIDSLTNDFEYPRAIYEKAIVAVGLHTSEVSDE